MKYQYMIFGTTAAVTVGYAPYGSTVSWHTVTVKTFEEAMKMINDLEMKPNDK